MTRCLLCGLLLALLPLLCSSEATGAAEVRRETPVERDGRMEWWRESRFGMFIHWGLYAIPAGRWDGKTIPGASEWLINSARIKIGDYQPLLSQFHPGSFNAREWVKLAKKAGMKYVVITSKHHEGFALWPSDLTDWDVASSPFKRDILREVADACKAEGLHFATYHSIMDWHHPDYLPRRPWDPRPDEKADFDRFVVYLKGQLKEIITHYDPDILWFDGEWEDTWTHEMGADLYNYVRSLKPDILINNRVDKGRSGMAGLTISSEFAGDFGTPEQEVPAGGLPSVDWESCMTMNDSWGFHADDHNWKSSQNLIRTLIDAVSKGGNYLLNVGPMADGRIPPESVERLEAMGRWMKVNRESIYGTSASPLPRIPHWGRVTRKENRLYLHVYETRDGSFTVSGLRNEVKRAFLLDGRHPVKTRSTDGGLEITLPAGSRDEAATVVVLELKGEPVVEILPLRADASGSFTLLAADADIKGSSLRLEADKNALGYWTDASAAPSWNLSLSTPGTYDVILEVSCADDSAGAEFALEIAGKRLLGKVPATGGWSNFKRLSLGAVTLDQGGLWTLIVRPITRPGYGVMNLRSVTLKPGDPS